VRDPWVLGRHHPEDAGPLLHHVMGLTRLDPATHDPTLKRGEPTNHLRTALGDDVIPLMSPS
jgi:hypothetical protein